MEVLCHVTTVKRLMKAICEKRIVLVSMPARAVHPGMYISLGVNTYHKVAGRHGGALILRKYLQQIEGLASIDLKRRLDVYDVVHESIPTVAD